MSDLASAASKVRILLVEAEAPVVETLTDHLQRLGHEVVGVTDRGVLAVELATRTRPDLVMMDIHLEGEMDGVEAAEHIYRQLGTPVVYVTAQADAATVERAYATAPFGYVVKPFQERDLRLAVGVAMRRHAHERAIWARQQDSEELFRVAFEGASIGIGLLGADGRIVRVNDALGAMLGYAPAELVGRPVASITHHEDTSGSAELVARAFRGELSHIAFEKRYAHKDGRPVWTHISASVVTQVSGQKFIVAYIQDITERKRAEVEQREAARRLQETELQLRVALGAARMGTFEWDVQRDRFEWDDAACNIYGLTRETMPRDRVTFRSFVHPEDRERVKTLADTAITTGSYRGLEYRILQRDGTVRWVAARGALARGDDGTPSKIVGGILDVTTERSLDEQRRASQKLEAIGQLSAGIAHNFNNMLMGILPNLELALPEVSSDAAELLTSARESAQRAAEMVRQLMTFAGQTGPAIRRREDVVEMVRRSLQICRRTFDRSIELPFQIHDGPELVMAEPAQLEQALLNVLINARDAVTSSGVAAPCVRVSVERVSAGAEEIAQCDLTPGRDYVRVRISDNGPGMDDTTRRRIFDPFFTTKEVGHGTGLGLSTTMAIVREHGGAIACVSAPGAGATFSIYLPRVQGGVAVEAAPAPAVGGAETILVVDDEPAIRIIVKRILERAGYDVRLAASGQDAFEQLGDAATRAKVALVLLDMSMPSMPGAEVRRRLKELVPTARVAYFTGYSPDSKDDVDGVIEKPIASRDLLRRVREMLDGARPGL